jgi:uncharacterized protein (TIGR00255 family)
MFSMTGYGRCELEQANFHVQVEISAVNHRYCELNVRMPKAFLCLEESLRKHIKEKITRGKIEVGIWITPLGGEDTEVLVNENLFKAYLQTFRSLGEKYNVPDNLGLAEMLKLGEMTTLQKKQVDLDTVMPVILSCMNQALDALLKMREKEGDMLMVDILAKLQNISKIVQEAEGYAQSVVENYRKRLTERLQKVSDGVIHLDESRIASEVVLYADKCAIDEELLRLRSHIGHFEAILAHEEVIGRKLDFLLQEMNREANTIASKVADLGLTNCAIALKTEIEKIREQIQNVE